MDYPFGINKTRAEQMLFAHESRTNRGSYGGGRDNVTLLWKSMLAKYQLIVLIDSAENLAKKDFFGLSDPYVKMSFRGPLGVFPYFTSFGNDPVPDYYKTKTIPKTLNPSWKHSFTFAVSGTEGTIIFDCYDENILISDDFLGRVYFTFNLTEPNSPYYVAVQPVAGGTGSRLRDYVLEEKYQSGDLDRLPYLSDLKRRYTERRKSRKHKLKGKLKIMILFEERNRWEDLIASFGPFFGLQREPIGNLADQFELLTVESSGDPSQPTNQNTVAEESDDESEELPAGWEERIDSNRRRVFINHDTRMVSMQRPRNQEQQQDTSTTRVFLPRMHSVEEEEEVEGGWMFVPSSPTAANADVFTSDTTNTSSSTTTTSTTISSTTTQTATSNMAAGLNTEELPPGWEKRKTYDGKTFYIDHNTRTTSWTLSKRGLHTLTKKVSQMSSQRTESVTKTALMQADEQDDSLPPGWEARRTDDGKVYYIDHNTRSTTWTHPGKSQVPLPVSCVS